MTHMILCPQCGVNLIPYDDAPLCQECERRDDERAEAEIALERRIDDLLPSLDEEDFEYLFDWAMRYYDDNGSLPSDQELLGAL